MQPGIANSASRISRIEAASWPLRPGSGQWKTMNTKLMIGC
jgi:hypothetical protein